MSAPAFSAPFPAVVPPPTPYSSALPPFLSPLGKVLDRIDATRERLNLPDPGKAEELGREAKSTSMARPERVRDGRWLPMSDD